MLYFTFDAREELQKIANHALESYVFCRILTNDFGTGAQWPLSRKFGRDENMAVDLMGEAGDLGLIPCGISFHVGSQKSEPTAGQPLIAQIGKFSNNSLDLA